MLFGTTPVWSHSELLLMSTIGILFFDNSLIWSLFTSTISANANFVVNKIPFFFCIKNSKIIQKKIGNFKLILTVNPPLGDGIDLRFFEDPSPSPMGGGSIPSPTGGFTVDSS